MSSIIDSIVGGVVDGIRTVFGLGPAPAPSNTQPTTRRASASHPTTFERGSSTARTGSSSPAVALPTGTSSTLADTLRRVATGSASDVARSAFGLASGSTPRTSPLPGGTTTDRPPAGTSPAPAPSPAAATRTGSAVYVYDSSNPTADGRAGFLGDARSLATQGTGAAAAAARNVQRGVDWFGSTFGRNGIDDAGGAVSVVVNDRSTDANGTEIFRGNGGYYLTREADGSVNPAIRFGTGTQYQHRNGGLVDQNEMQYADDLTIHEVTHGVIDRETGIVGGTEDETGAVSEGMADVMAASATRDWRIGEGMYAPDSDYTSMRNIAAPNDPTAVHGLWTSMAQYRTAAAQGQVEEHYASGILSTSAYRMQRRLSGGGEAGWRSVEQLFYAAITSGTLGSMDFASTAATLRSEAARLWGAGSSNAAVVDEELRRSGI